MGTREFQVYKCTEVIQGLYKDKGVVQLYWVSTGLLGDTGVPVYRNSIEVYME